MYQTMLTLSSQEDTDFLSSNEREVLTVAGAASPASEFITAYSSFPMAPRRTFLRALVSPSQALLEVSELTAVPTI